MENQVTPTFKFVSHNSSNKSITSNGTCDPSYVTEKVIDFLAKNQRIDLAEIEDKMTQITESIKSKKPDIVVRNIWPENPIVETVVQSIPSPIVNVSVPEQVTEVKNEIQIKINPWWIIFACSLPTLLTLLNNFLIMRFKV